MNTIVLIVHLLIALALILTVLLQRSEGGGLGIGGGGGGVASGRPPTSPIAKFTWMLAVAFLVTSLTLTWISAENSGSRSLVDDLELEGDSGSSGILPPTLGEDLLPPTPSDAPVTPPPAGDPTIPPPVE